MTRSQVLILGASVVTTLACMAGIAWIRRARVAGTAGMEPGREEYRQTLFALLAFPYTPPPKRLPESDAPRRPDPFPAKIRELHGKKVSIFGYMAPLSMNAGRIDSFYLSRGVFSCCFADAPRMTDYIRVTMAPGQFAPNADLVQVNGVLDIGEECNSMGYVETVYRMKADAVKSAEIEGSGWAEAVAWGVGGLLFLALFGPAVIRLARALRERYCEVPGKGMMPRTDDVSYGG